MALNIPQSVLKALTVLREAGIPADIYPMYGTSYINYVISLPGVVIKEINENPEPEQTK